MCGIFGIIGTNLAAPDITFKGLSDIEYRGYDSWGVAYKERVEGRGWRVEKEVGFLPSTLHLPQSQIALGHTRWATHGGVTKVNAHPHLSCDGNLVLVHNGIVENYLELKEKLSNHKIKSETDSEIVIHLIEDEYLKSKDLALSTSNVFKTLLGLNAIVVSDGNQIVACKVGSPLVAGKSKEGFIIASDPNAILPFSKKLLFLEDNQLVSLRFDLKLYNALKLTRLRPKFISVSWDYSTTSLKNYKHYMLKEIYDQPKILQAIAKNSKEIEKVAGMIRSAFGTFFIACGSASYACLAGVYLFSKIAKKHINFSIGSEFSYIQDYLTPKSLLMAVSQSGETIDVVEPVTLAKQKKTKIISMVNVLGSTLYRMADYPLLLQAGVEKAVCSTKALTAMFAKMILLSYSLINQRKEGEKILIDSAKEIKLILKQISKIKNLAQKLSKHKHIFILGRGLSYPVALEAALKIKEISYIHAEGFAAGELKHGVIALIEKGTPVIVFVPKDETLGGVLANAMEVSARGAFVIGVGYENNPVFDFFFKVNDCGASSIIPHVVFAQLLAYYLAIELGKNPDKPRNLAKSVVVR